MKQLITCLLLLCLAGAQAQQNDTTESRHKIPSYFYKNDLKVTMLSLFSGSTKLTYERLITRTQSVEITGGVIGWGGDWLNHNRSQGGLCRVAYKFIFRPIIQHEPSTPSGYYLNGFYLKPEVAFSSFSYEAKEGGERLHNNRIAIMGCVGYQWVCRRFVFDIFGGLGAGIGDENEYNYYHGFIALPKGSPTAFTAGFKLGVAF
ncbi:MAG: hypothetical protein J5873_06525 [Bacteroidales bacterium]|nr:hypothetical protein [Bacteroidales bacterium]